MDLSQGSIADSWLQSIAEQSFSYSAAFLKFWVGFGSERSNFWIAFFRNILERTDDCFWFKSCSFVFVLLIFGLLIWRGSENCCFELFWFHLGVEDALVTAWKFAFEWEFFFQLRILNVCLLLVVMQGRFASAFSLFQEFEWWIFSFRSQTFCEILHSNSL